MGSDGKSGLVPGLRFFFCKEGAVSCDDFVRSMVSYLGVFAFMLEAFGLFLFSSSMVMGTIPYFLSINKISGIVI